MKKLNDKGFSLMELLVAIAIMALTVSMVAVGVSTLSSADANKANNSIRSSIELLRTNSMAIAADYYLEISNKAGKQTIKSYKNGNLIEETDLGKRVKITFTASSSGSETSVALQEGQSAFIKYDISTGRVSNFVVGADVSYENDRIDNVLVTKSVFSSGTEFAGYNSVTIKIKGRNTQESLLYLKTGLFAD